MDNKNGGGGVVRRVETREGCGEGWGGGEGWGEKAENCTRTTIKKCFLKMADWLTVYLRISWNPGSFHLLHTL